MRITRLSLSDVRRHASLEIRPAAGLTVIRGPNEAGKSTIHEALELVLFRKADSNHQDVRRIRRWATEAHPEIALEFEVDGQQGRLVKRFAGPKAEAELTLGETASRDFTLIQEQVAAITGIPNEAFFRSTASVGHAELDEVDGDAPAISDRLQKAISGADRGTATAKRKLEAAIHRYRTEGHKNPGLLKVCAAEIARLERELAAGETALAQLQADRSAWAEAHERCRALDLELARRQAELEEARRAEQLALQRDEAQGRYDRLKRGTEMVEEANALRAGLPTGTSAADIRAHVGRAVVLEAEISGLAAELEANGAPADGHDARIPVSAVPARWSRSVPWFVAAGIALVAAVLVALVVAGPLGIVALVGLTVLGLVLLGLGVRAAVHGRAEASAREQGQAEAAARQALARDRQERAGRLRSDLAAVLGELGASDVPAAQALLFDLEAGTERLARIEGELRGLGIEERDPRHLATLRDQAADAADQARHALAGMGAEGQDPGTARRTAQRLVDQAISARDRARSEEDQARGRVDANATDAEAVAEQAERLAVARARQAELERRVRTYEETLRAIEAAEQATLKTAARYLEEHMGPVVARITAGRYRDVEVDDQTLRFRVRAPETSQMIDVEQLSQGTSDQLFLAARLGLVRLVTMDRRPPIILDDPFVTFDDERARRALELLREVAIGQRFQVILLTCSERFDVLADTLVVLEGPGQLDGAQAFEPPVSELSGALA